MIGFGIVIVKDNYGLFIIIVIQQDYSNQMIASPELLNLQDYTLALQKENQANKAEMTILYRELESMERQIRNMEKYYYQNRQLEKQIQQMKQSLLQQNESSKSETNVYEKNEQSLLLSIHQIESELNDKNATILELQKHITNSNYEQQTMNEQIAKYKAALNEKSLQNQQLLLQIQQKDQHISQLESRIKEWQTAQDSSEQQPDLDHFIQNYHQIETVVIEKQEQIQQMEKDIGQLNQRCSTQMKQLKLKQLHFKKLQSRIEQLRQKAQANRNLAEHEQSCGQLKEFSKMDLIKNSNKMIERICSLEKQNNCFALNLSEIQMQTSRQVAGKTPFSAHNQLQIKIRTLKMQNERLTQNLAL